MELTNHTKGALCCLLGILVLCPDTVCLRFLGEIRDTTMMFYKYVMFSCTFLLVYLLKEGSQVLTAFKTLGKLGFAAGIVLGISGLAITYAFINTAIANVVVIIASNPLFSAFFSYIFLKEEIPTRTLLASIVSFLAIILIFYAQLGSGGSRANTFGMIAAIVTAFAEGLFFALIRWAVKVGDNPDMVPCNAIAGVLIVLIVSCISGGECLRDITGRQIGILFVESVIILPIAFTLLTIGPRYISAPETALFMLVETVVAPFLIWLAGFEAPPLSAIYGGIVLLFALAVNSYFAMREASHSAMQSEDDIDYQQLDSAKAVNEADGFQTHDPDPETTMDNLEVELVEQSKLEQV